MKKIGILLVLFTLGVMAAIAADIKLQDGRTFTDASILNQSADNVTIRHSGGLTSVKKSLLPDDLRAKYPITEPPKPSLRAIATAQHRINYISPDPLPMGPTGKEITIKGQCFIVTRGGTNYKLGNVLVSFYPESIFSEYLRMLSDEADPILKEWDQLQKAAERNGDYESSLRYLRRIIRAGHDKYLALPPAPYSTRTDADGKFSITHNLAGTYIICAVAERELPRDEPELYEWHVSSDRIEDPTNLNLSNHNL